MPSVTQRRVGPVVHLGWSEADTGNSTITSYQIMRGTASGAETLLATVGGTQTTYDDLTANDITKTYYYKVVAINGEGMSCANNEVAAPYVGDTCGGLIIHQNDPSHPESAAVMGGANPQLAIDYVAVGEPPSTSNLMFKMKVSNLTTIPPNSRWRMVWDSFSSPGQQFYVGMKSGSGNAQPTFEYGTIATAVVGLVVGVPTETKIGPALPASNFNADGMITIFVPKSAVGSPQPGDLLGAVNGRTFTGDTPQTDTLERSTALIDHTFVKAQTDNAFPAATYTVVGNVACGGADLAVLKTGPSTGHVGQQITYTITATNNGPQTANGVTLTDTLPKNTGFGSATSTQGSCAPTPHQQLVTCNIGTMNSGGTVTVTLVTKPTKKGDFTDTATVSATSPNDPVSGNNTSSVTTKVSP